MRPEDLDVQQPSDLVVGPLRLKVAGRQFPESQDYWDGNWLDVVATCTTPRSSARISGAVVHLPELKRWLAALESLHESGSGAAELGCLEPGLGVMVELGSLGAGTLEIGLEQLHEEQHRWTVATDQSYLPEWIRQLRDLLDRFPVRGRP